MKQHCKSPRRQKAVGEVPDSGLAPLQRLVIEPPPKEAGPERLYRVVYVIDINAMNGRQAAERAYEIMTDPHSMRPVLAIIDSSGRQMRVDLSDG